MAERTRDAFWRRNNPIMWGVLATTAVFAFGLWAASQSVCHTNFWGNRICGGNKWSAFLAAAPNEVGDTLAGFAGALAFVWLIATVWLQGQELAAQREELREQRQATQDMARSMAAQASVFEEEQRQRNELRAKELLLEKMEFYRESFRSYYGDIKWEFSRPIDSSTSIVESKYWPLGAKSSVPTAEFFARIPEELRELGGELKGLYRRGLAVAKPKSREPLVNLVTSLQELIDIRADLSAAQMVKFDRLRVVEQKEIIERFLLQEEWFQSNVKEPTQ